MTETELTDRLREQLILNGPDAWQTGDYPYQAAQLGLSDEDARKRAMVVRDEVLANSLLLDQIRARIARLIEPSRVHLYEQDLSKIINAAGSLGLSPDFVRSRWIPAEKARLMPTPPVQPPMDMVQPTPEPRVVDEPVKPVVVPPVVVLPPVEEPPAPVVVPEPVITRSEPVLPPEPAPISRREPEPTVGPPPVVRSFTATPARVKRGQPVTLDWDVVNVLAVTIDDLGEGLSPKNRGWVKPSKSTDYTLFDANNNPLSTVRVEVIKPDRSGLYGVLFALALLVIIYWFVRSSNTRQPPKREETRQEETLNRQLPYTEREPVTSAADEPVPASTDTVATSVAEAPVATEASPEKTTKESEPAVEQTTDTRTASTDNTPTTPSDARQGRYEESFGNSPYDKVELGVDDHGWRRARKNGRWGYIDQHDNWVIEPRFEAITPFRNDIASAFLDGQLLKIDRSGEPVRP
ncbi:WG repeat protein [Spirosoma oryzae]|uniref:WG repeat protein n=1 Tax=Spirosoma oryzae TaxID=1469603 RepID=A0A2T0SW16_9BACT|nr:WG repeat-containing protein [Spirosoma oryzae]PRY37606.1 WG repeat protein [Spirosoma oryzae]